MIRERVVGLKGNVIEILRPENDEDVEELRRMEQRGEAQTQESFADFAPEEDQVEE